MKKLLLLIPLVVLIVGCGDDEEGTVFFPLTVDNEWNYDMTMTETTPSDTTVKTGTQSQEITAETTLDNGTTVFEQMFIMTIEIDTFTIVDTSIEYIEETEDFLLVYDDKADTIPDTVAALPPEAGKTWNVDDSTTAAYIGQESVTVPAGTFSNCWKMVHIDSGVTDTTYIYVAENVGPVKMNWIEVEADTIFQEMLMELDNYDVE